MPSRRELIRMTDAEVESFLDSQLFGVLGTTGKDGLPHLVTVGYMAHGRSVSLTTFQKAQKFVNAERAGMASFLVEIAHPYNAIRGVYLSGPVTIDRDPAAVAAVSKAIRGKNTPEDEAETPDMDYEEIAPKRAIITIEPHKVVSWDHRKLGGVY